MLSERSLTPEIFHSGLLHVTLQVEGGDEVAFDAGSRFQKGGRWFGHRGDSHTTRDDGDGFEEVEGGLAREAVHEGVLVETSCTLFTVTCEVHAGIRFWVEFWAFSEVVEDLQRESWVLEGEFACGD